MPVAQPFLFQHFLNIITNRQQKLQQLSRMSLFGVQVNSQLNQLILNIRLSLSNTKYQSNFRTIYRSFALSDPSITGLISSNLFEKRLNENGIFFKKTDMQVFTKAYANQQGMINWFVFLGHVREPMGPIRKQAVEEIFTKLGEGQNEISIQQLQKHFTEDGYDSFKKVTKTEHQSYQNFIGLVSIQNNKISKQQFINYYDDINVNFPSDESFLRFISHTWNSEQKKIERVSEQEIIAAIKGLRYKLIQKTSGTCDEFLLRKVFDQFDMNRNSSIGAYQLDLMLKKLQLVLPSKLITPLLYHLDKNKSGYLQFDQFKHLIFFEPFVK